MTTPKKDQETQTEKKLIQNMKDLTDPEFQQNAKQWYKKYCDNTNIYDEGYTNIYRKIYEQMKQIYNEKILFFVKDSIYLNDNELAVLSQHAIEASKHILHLHAQRVVIYVGMYGNTAFPEFPKDYKEFYAVIYTAMVNIYEQFARFDLLSEEEFRKLCYFDFFAIFQPDESTNAPSFSKLRQFKSISLLSTFYAKDKVNRKVWTNNNNGENYTAFLGTEVNKKTQQVTDVVNTYTCDYNALAEHNIKLDRLNSFDRRVHTAVASFYKSGYTVFTSKDIYNQMGYSVRHTPNTLKKIEESMHKLMSVVIRLNHENDNIWYGDAQRKETISNILNIRGITIVRGGQEVEAYQLLTTPILLEWAEFHNQITSFPNKLLDTGLNKTEQSLDIENYLLDIISYYKNRNEKSKKKQKTESLLFETLFNECSITERKQKNRTIDKVKKVLDHFQSENWVKYKFDDDKKPTRIIFDFS